MFLARHGQTIFNVVFGQTRKDPGIEDPPLTEEGFRQACSLAEKLEALEIERLISSPYTRALQTAWAVGSRLNLGVTVEANVRERTAYICDIGASASTLADAWPGLDLSNLDEIWWTPEGESIPAFHERCAAFRRSMAHSVDWPHTAVITHWGVIRSMTGSLAKNAELLQCNPEEPHPDIGRAWP
ncbi:MAG: histidine phosphatase family protein [Pseudomonadota bacterium]|nr:histidine phosphatase family protein [Pseudomonadota bacterium]